MINGYDILSRFSTPKIAYHLPDEEWANGLTSFVGHDRFFSDINGSNQIPDGWDVVGTDMSGASGFVIVFESDGLPTVSDLEQLEAGIQNYASNLKVYDGIVYDDVVEGDESKGESAWASVCENHYQGTDDSDGATGVCGVAGCHAEAMHYEDFPEGEDK